MVEPTVGRSQDRGDVVDDQARCSAVGTLTTALAELATEEGLVEVDAEGRIATATGQAHRLLGAAPGSLPGLPVARLLERVVDVPPAAARRGGHPVVSCLLEQLEVQPAEPARGEVALTQPDGTVTWLKVAVRVPEGGSVPRYVASLVDVTELKLREAQLEDANRRLARANVHLEQAHELASIGHWEADVRTGQVSWSPVIYDIFGVHPASFVPTVERVFAAMHPDDRDRVLAAGTQDLVGDRHEMRYRIVRPDGELRWVHELATRTFDRDGALVRLTGTLQDLTELTRSEQALRDSEELLMRVLRATDDGWWDNDLVDGVAFHSPRWLEIHGLDPGTAADTPDLWRRVTHPDDLAAIDAAFAAAVAQRQTHLTVRGRAVHQHDGRELHLIVRMLIDYDAAGRPVRTSGATSDVTELVRAESIKEDFVSTVSHELRTPLTAIGGSLELVLAGAGGAVDPRAVELLELAQRNTGRLRRLIDDLLDMERVITGQLSFELEVTSLRAVVARTIEATRSVGAARGVAVVLAPGAEDAQVLIDPTRVDQVVANLLSNAVKFAPVGTTVTVRLVTEGPQVRVEVEDGGSGVPDGFADRVFHRFQQADPLDARSRGGTGLGLAISRELIERMGGEVGFRSQPGCTVFWFRLPVVADD